MILACNHPNSFLDAIIIGSHCKYPVHFLARGDAFRNPLIRSLLTALKMIPIYRLSEGREYLALNDVTFEKCREVLLKKGIVLIFSEGLCVNGWQLRPLKKGTARIALAAWGQPSIATNLAVVPVGINYNSFNRLGKNVLVHAAAPIYKKSMPGFVNEGQSVADFNSLLGVALLEGILQQLDDAEAVQVLLSNHAQVAAPTKSLIVRLKKNLFLAEKTVAIKKLTPPGQVQTSLMGFITDLLKLLAVLPFALISFAVHAPLYVPIRFFVKRKTVGTVFYDSVLFGILLLVYPFYWLLLVASVCFITQNTLVRCIVLLTPIMAWVHIYSCDVLQRAINYFRLSHSERRSVRKLLLNEPY